MALSSSTVMFFVATSLLAFVAFSDAQAPTPSPTMPPSVVEAPSPVTGAAPPAPVFAPASTPVGMAPPPVLLASPPAPPMAPSMGPMGPSPSPSPGAPPPPSAAASSHGSSTAVFVMAFLGGFALLA